MKKVFMLPIILFAFCGCNYQAKEQPIYDSHRVQSHVDEEAVVVCWVYTAPSDGKYLIVATAMFESSSAWTAGEYAFIAAFNVDTSLGYTMDYRKAEASGTYAMFVGGMCLVEASASDTIYVYVYQTSGSTLTLDDSGDISHVSITRLFD